METFFKKLKKGFVSSIHDSQILYTSFLLIVIPLAFIFTAQIFLDVSRTHQETLERRSISLMHDTFVEFAALHMDEPWVIQEAILDISEQNTHITDLKVLTTAEQNSYRVVASSNQQEVGSLDETVGVQVLYRDAIAENSKFLTYVEKEARKWAVVREITGKNGATLGIVYTSVSMAWLDAIIANRLVWAYAVLVFVIIVIGALLVRQARVIDYAVLYKRLKEVDQMKDDFISIAAHELRTPLTVIRGYTDMLNESKRLSDADRQMTKNISQSAEHLNKMIGDILDVSRLQQGRLSFDMQTIQPAPIIYDVVESLQYTANQKGLSLTSDIKESAFIHVDSNRLKQILINIIGNALKYTKKGGITVHTFVEGKNYTIRISDTGIGMSAEDRGKLFTRFYRVQTKETEDIRGTGLGLWITKKIVEQMKGRISVESIKGKGTDFVVTFSVEQPRSEESLS